MSTEKLGIYKCEHCGNIIEVLHGGGAKVICCKEPMKRYEENTVEAATEKHLPIVEKVAGGYKVTVGDVAHPMEEKHFIEWIELVVGNAVYREFLEPGQTPEATFLTEANEVKARAYCNLHGLWSS